MRNKNSHQNIMRKFLKNFFCTVISVMLVLLSSINTYAESNSKTKEFMNNHSEILKSIKECSKCIDGKGDIRADFLEEVIHINDIQICMAENIIKCGDDKNIRNIAKSLIKNSMECTTELNEDLYNISKELSSDKELEEKYLNEYKKLYSKMILNLQCKREDESIEKIFLRVSIKHHEALIELADVFCEYSDDEKMIETAKNIQKKNTKEIKKLKTAFKKCN